MKKILLVLMMTLLSACFVNAQTVLFMQNGTLEWDAPLDEEGNIIPIIELSYEIYRSDYPVGNPEDPNTLEFLGTTNELTFPVILGIKKTGFAVRAIRTNDEDVLYSILAWSYIAEDADPVIGPWIARWLPRPDKPKKIRIYY